MICPFCGSKDIRPHGTYKTKIGEIRRFLCKSCKRTFSRVVRPMARYNPMLVEISADLYEKGVSLRGICNHLKKFYGTKISPTGVHKWVLKKGCKKREKPRLKRATHALIRVAEDLYKKGLSVRDIAHHFRAIYHVELSYPIIYHWIRGTPKGRKPRIKGRIKEWRKLSPLYSHGKTTATRVVMLPAILLREAGMNPTKDLVGRWGAIEKGRLLLEIKEVK